MYASNTDTSEGTMYSHWWNTFHLLQGVWHPVKDECLVLHGGVEVWSEGWVTKWVCVRMGTRIMLTSHTYPWYVADVMSHRCAIQPGALHLGFYWGSPAQLSSGSSPEQHSSQLRHASPVCAHNRATSLCIQPNEGQVTSAYNICTTVHKAIPILYVHRPSSTYT